MSWYLLQVQNGLTLTVWVEEAKDILSRNGKKDSFGVEGKYPG